MVGGQTTARGWERRVWDSEEGSRRRVIVASARDRPGSSGLGVELRPRGLVTHSLSHVLVRILLLPASLLARNVVLSRPPTTSLHRTVRPRL